MIDEAEEIWGADAAFLRLLTSMAVAMIATAFRS
jgi:hypothetical protein